MRRPPRFLLLVPAFAALTACGLGLTGLGPDDAGFSFDAGAHHDASLASDTGSATDSATADMFQPPTDAGVEEVADVIVYDGPLLVLCVTDVKGTDGGCYPVPAGWAPVAYTGTQAVDASPKVNCPRPAYDQDGAQPVYYSPDFTNACGCGPLSILDGGSCPYGLMTFEGCSSDFDASYEATPVCTSLNAATQFPYSVAITAPPIVGQCTFPGVPQKDGIPANGWTCTPQCSTTSCTLNRENNLLACIEQVGGASCPAGSVFSTPFSSLGTSVNYTCSDCACAVTGSCGGGRVDFFMDLDCMEGGVGAQTTGGCVGAGSPTPTYGSFSYLGSAPNSVRYVEAGGSTPSGEKLNGVETICCMAP